MGIQQRRGLFGRHQVAVLLCLLMASFLFGCGKVDNDARALAEPLGRVNEVAHAVWSCVERAEELLHHDLLLLLGL